MIRARQFGAEYLLCVMVVKVCFYLNKAAFRLTDGQLTGFRYTALLSGLHHDPVHHYLYVMLVCLLELDLILIEDPDFPVHSDSGESLASYAVQDLFVSALLAPHHGCQHQQFGSLIHGHDGVHHLVNRLGCYRLPADGTVRLAYPRKKKSEVVMDLGNSSHGRSGVPVGGLLIDGDGGAQTLDIFHVWFLHLAQELTGIGRQGLHVPALSFGVDRVEGKRRFTGTR